MALYTNLSRSLYWYLRSVVCFSKHYNQNVHKKGISFEINALDPLDNFTTQLVQKKTDKWSAQKHAQKLLYDINSSRSKDSDYKMVKEQGIKDLTITQINTIFQELIELCDNPRILNLTIECIKYHKCPSLSNLMYVLSYCAQVGDITTIQQIKSLCEDVNPGILRMHSNFNHFMAEAIWIKGNICESLKIFRNVYDENAYLRRKIRLTFKYLIAEVISNRSEATLINLIKFSEDLVQNYKDFFPLTCIWQICFLSEWYSDQCAALELLEKNDGLLNVVINQIPYVVSVSLSQHRTEIVYRLLEILLKYEMKIQYTGVLLALLNYQVRKGDICGCLEIIQWSVKYNVELPTIHHKKFLNLLVHYNIEVHKLETLRKQKPNTDYKF